MSTPAQGSQGSGGGDSRPVRIPVLADLGNRGEAYDIDSRLINGYAEVQPNKDAWIYKRPGLTPWGQPPAGPAPGLGIYNWGGFIYSVFGNTLYRNTTALGTVDASLPYTFNLTRGATPTLFLSNGNSYYSYNTTDGLQHLAPGTFTVTVPGSVYLDGTMYVMDQSANIFGSNLNTVADGQWPADNLIVAQIEPDAAVALAKQLVYAIAFKVFSTEMFYDAGNATGSPLGSVPGQKLNYGLRHAGTLAELSGVLFWVDQIKTGGMSVRVMDQLTAQPCSTPQVERLLQLADGAGYFNGPVYAWTAKIDGHMFYCLTIQQLNVTLVFDATQKLWYQWTDANGNYMPIVGSSFTGGTTLVQHQSNGFIYEFDSKAGTDQGNIITTDLYTPEYDGGTYRGKVLSKMRIIGDVTPGNSLQIRVSDDDFTSWSNFRTVDMGQSSPTMDNCGTFRRRVWHIRQATQTGGRLFKALEPELELCDL